MTCSSLDLLALLGWPAMVAAAAVAAAAAVFVLHADEAIMPQGGGGGCNSNRLRRYDESVTVNLISL